MVCAPCLLGMDKVQQDEGIRVTVGERSVKSKENREWRHH